MSAQPGSHTSTNTVSRKISALPHSAHLHRPRHTGILTRTRSISLLHAHAHAHTHTPEKPREILQQKGPESSRRGLGPSPNSAHWQLASRPWPLGFLYFPHHLGLECLVCLHLPSTAPGPLLDRGVAREVVSIQSLAARVGTCLPGTGTWRP